MILIICALKLEAKPFLNALEHKKVEKCNALKVNKGEILGSRVIVVKSGVGALKAAYVTRSLIEKYDVSQIIMARTAGGTDRTLNIGDTVVSAEIIFHDDAGELFNCYELLNGYSVSY